MSSSSYPYPNNQTRINWRRIGLFTAVFLTATLIIAGISLYFSPIGQRWQANQTAVSPTVGSTDITIIADDRLNHIFAPAVTQVKTGTAVTWHFQEVDESGQPVAHNVVFDDLASPVQATGTFSRSFEQTGTYTYVCTLHPFMEGAVVVTE